MAENLLWYPQNFQKAYNDRINVTFERQLPQQIVASFTWFSNFGQQHYTKQLNAINPTIEQQFANNFSALSANVNNPFYHYLNSTLIPGPLFNQPTVSLRLCWCPIP